MIKFFYELPVSTRFFYLGSEYIKVNYSMEGEQGFNAVGIDAGDIKFLWNQQVKTKE